MSDEKVFEQRGNNPENEMDRLAKAFHNAGSKSVGEQRNEALEAQARADAAIAALAEEHVKSPEENLAPDVEEEQALADAAADEGAGEVEETDSESSISDEEEPAEGAEAAEDDAGEQEMVELEDGTQVPLQELVQGHLRQADYTRKTQELAETRKAFEAEKNGYIEQQAQVGQYLTQLAQQLEAQVKQEADPQELEALRTSDPAEYSARMIEAQRKEQLVAAAKAQQVALYNQQRYDIVTRERAALAEKHEGFAKDFDGTYAEITKWVTSPEGGGLPAEMWDQIYDHRAVLLVEKAMKHDRATKVKAPKVTRKLAKLPKVVRPGRKIDARQAKTSEYADALSKAKTTGSVGDLAKAFALKERMKRKA
jgi:hypothetical protein